MTCDTCGERFSVCPNASPRQWAVMAVALTSVAALLLLLAIITWSLAAALFALVGSMGAGYAWFAARNCRDWAQGFRDGRCPECGHRYEVTIWSANS